LKILNDEGAQGQSAPEDEKSHGMHQLRDNAQVDSPVPEFHFVPISETTFEFPYRHLAFDFAGTWLFVNHCWSRKRKSLPALARFFELRHISL
jgi:hypothetical protein